MNRRQLAADHLWIARYHAKRLAGTIDYWDLLGIAQLALVQAAKRWPGKQSFIPYATSRIVWRIQDAIRKTQVALANPEPFSEQADLSEPEAESVYYVRDWIDQLPADEQRAIRMAYGIGMKPRALDEIARSLKCGLTKTGKIVQSGLLRLRYMATVEQCDGGPR